MPRRTSPGPRAGVYPLTTAREDSASTRATSSSSPRLRHSSRRSCLQGLTLPEAPLIRVLRVERDGQPEDGGVGRAPGRRRRPHLAPSLHLEGEECDARPTRLNGEGPLRVPQAPLRGAPPGRSRTTVKQDRLPCSTSQLAPGRPRRATRRPHPLRNEGTSKRSDRVVQEFDLEEAGSRSDSRGFVRVSLERDGTSAAAPLFFFFAFDRCAVSGAVDVEWTAGYYARGRRLSAGRAMAAGR